MPDWCSKTAVRDPCRSAREFEVRDPFRIRGEAVRGASTVPDAPSSPKCEICAGLPGWSSETEVREPCRSACKFEVRDPFRIGGEAVRGARSVPNGSLDPDYGLNHDALRSAGEGGRMVGIRDIHAEEEVEGFESSRLIAASSIE